MDLLPLEIIVNIVKNLSYTSSKNLVKTCRYLFYSRFFLLKRSKYGEHRDKLEKICEKHILFYRDADEEPHLLATNFPYSMIDIGNKCNRTALVYCLKEGRNGDYVWEEKLKPGKILYLPKIFDAILWLSFDRDCEISLVNDEKESVRDGPVRKGERVYMDSRGYEYILSAFNYCHLVNRSDKEVYVTIKYIIYFNTDEWLREEVRNYKIYGITSKKLK